jgi:hypothetical protein
LVEKSLAVAETTETEPRLRLLETTRAYALERLPESGEWEAVARRHAEYYGDLFERAEIEWGTRSSPQWLADYQHEIDNMRTALNWAVSAVGDAALGLALTVAAIPLWLQLSMVEECRSWVEHALANLAPAERTDARAEMKLQAALSASLLFTKGATPRLGRPLPRLSTSPNCSAIPSTSCGRCGSFGFIALIRASTPPPSPLPKNFTRSHWCTPIRPTCQPPIG